ncbi:hypothetical protein VST01_20700, partial [Escherichia coli]|nr:hypothetical protein [Escherichia coli]
MQVFSSDVYFTVGTNALLASQKEYYSDLVALVDLGHSFVVIDEWICPYISRHLLSLNPLLACCRRYSR